MDLEAVNTCRKLYPSNCFWEVCGLKESDFYFSCLQVWILQEDSVSWKRSWFKMLARQLQRGVGGAPCLLLLCFSSPRSCWCCCCCCTGFGPHCNSSLSLLSDVEASLKYALYVCVCRSVCVWVSVFGREYTVNDGSSPPCYFPGFQGLKSITI